MHRSISLLFLLLLSEILSKNNANYCGEEIFSDTNGTINTNPILFEKNVTCLWTIHPPHSRITTIRISKTGLEKCFPKYPCCLSVVDGDSNRNYIKLCNESPKKPIKLSVRGNKTLIYLQASHNVQTWIDYSTRENSECYYSDFQCYDKTGCYNATDNCKGDFICNDHSDKVGCDNCPSNLTLCNLDSTKCFDPVSQRCDGVLHCPKGEDELSCSDLCPNSIKCPSERRCIRQDQICNSKTDCADGFDEKSCPIEASTNVYLSLMFIVISLCSMSFICIVVQWYSTRRSAQRFLNNPPEFPLAPFEGPGGEERGSSSSEVFTDSDFRQGGAIYESYMQTLKKSKPVKAILSTTNRQLSYMDLDGDNELIVLASLNVPVEMCIGLDVSDEKLNLTEVLTKERLKSISNAKVDVEADQEASGESSRSTMFHIEEIPSKTSILCSMKKSERTFTISDSSEWTDIEGTSESGSSRIIYVRSAKQ